MDSFKVPTSIPQDLLLIHELIGVQPSYKAAEPGSSAPTESVVASNLEDEDEDINSSDDEDDRRSEEEIAADLIATASDDEEILKVEADADSKPLTDSSVADSSSSDSESDSDSDSDEDEPKASTTKPPVAVEADDDDDEEGGPGPSGTGTYFQTKHEVSQIEVPIPDVDEVGADEVLERVGEVMNIMGEVAIIRGGVRGSDKALDSDTLLVFDDRKVMGFIYETFGPTTQPLYQVRFSAAFPLDQERVRLGREVFHVPARSNFVFVSQIKAIKGSDASNVYDEEPGEDEIEFSDDEAEAAHRSRLKRKRGESRGRSNAPSAASSRASTPNPTLLRDAELSAFDEYSPYDVDYAAPGPSRPAPIPYDDPYGDAYTAPDLDDSTSTSGATESTSMSSTRPEDRRSFDRSAPGMSSRGADGFDGRGRGRDNRGRGGRGGGRERGRGRGGGGGGDYRGGRQQFGGNTHHQQQRSQYGGGEPGYNDEYNPGGIQQDRSLSPASFAIQRATGGSGYPQRQQQGQYQQQQSQYYNPQQQQHQYSQFGGDTQQQWAYAQQQFMPQFGGGLGGYMNQGGYQYPSQSGGGGFGMHGVQPHINPRFASAFAFGMPQMHAHAHSSSSMSPSGTTSHAEAIASVPSGGSASSLSEWTVPLRDGSANGSGASSRAPSANPGEGN